MCDTYLVLDFATTQLAQVCAAAICAQFTCAPNAYDHGGMAVFRLQDYKFAQYTSSRVVKIIKSLAFGSQLQDSGCQAILTSA
jgi:hypothetical protein